MNSKISLLSEKPIYNLVEEGKNGFLRGSRQENPAVNYSNDATYLATLQNDLLVSKGQRQGRRITVLGIEQNAEGKHVLQLDEKGMSVLPFLQMMMETKTS